MLSILVAMIKEEWRIHSTIFGSRLFALYPAVICIGAFAAGIFIPFISGFFALRSMAVILHLLFLMTGVSVGAFGLLGREAMNRRFGQASLVAYSIRTLPISERRIFLNFLIKDIMYYLFLWVIPVVMGISLALPFIDISLSYAPLLLLTLTLSFMIGLSVIFLLSTFYVRYGRATFMLIVIALVSILYAGISYDMIFLFPPISLFFDWSTPSLWISLVLVILPSIISVFLLKIDYPTSRTQHENLFSRLVQQLSIFPAPSIMVKDFIDLKRSEGGLGKILFSYLFPVGLICTIIIVFTRIFGIFDFFVLFSIFLGVVSASVYNWLTEFDVYSNYSYLPLRYSDVLMGKIRTYLLINIISPFVLIIAAIRTGSLDRILPAEIAFISISVYVLSNTVYLTGLSPNPMLYNAEIYVKYAFLNVTPIVILMTLSAFSVNFLYVSIILLVAAKIFLEKAFRKWDGMDYRSQS